MRIVNDEAFQTFIKAFSRRKPHTKFESEFSTAHYPFGDIVNQPSINFETAKLVRIYIEPLVKEDGSLDCFDYWRFGIKFSPDPTPITRPRRNGPGYPLFHLTRNVEPEPVVGTTYYGSDGKYSDNDSGVILSNYKDAPIEIIAYPKADGLLAIVVMFEGRHIWSNVFELALHKYGWLSSWGDNVEYGLKVNIRIWE